jgi:hypothetical protein
MPAQKSENVMASTGDIIDGLVIGLHLVSAHSAPGMNDANPGIYVRTAGGATLGTYENSISGTNLNGNDGRRRTSVYLGWTWETPSQGLALTLGAVNGYGSDEQRSCVSAPPPPTHPPMAKGQVRAQASAGAAGCSGSNDQPPVRDVLPLAVISGRLPITNTWAARMGYVYVPGAFGPAHMHVANLMVEAQF